MIPRSTASAVRNPLPAGTIRLIVGFSPNSASDSLARIVAPELERILNRPVVLDRRVGADGAIAARALMASPADGLHLMIATLGTHALNPGIVADLPYHPTEDFTPIALLARTPLILGVTSGLPVATVAELIALARSRKLSFGCSAAIGAPRLASELFARGAGLDLTHAVYEQTEALYADLVAGRIAASFNNPMTMLPLLGSGQVKGLATTGRTPCAAAPSLPTMEACGFPGFTVENWVGVVAPAGLPEAKAEALNGAVRAALHSSSVQSVLAQQGIAVPTDDVRQFSDHIRSEAARWAPIAASLAAPDREEL